MSFRHGLNTQALREESLERNCSNVVKHLISSVSGANRVSWHHTGRWALTILVKLGTEQLQGVSGRAPTRNREVVCLVRPLRRYQGAHGRLISGQNYVSASGDLAKSDAR